MANTVFKRKVKFLSKLPDEEGKITSKETEKEFVFKELDRQDRDQFAMHFSVVDLFENSASNTTRKGDIKVKLNSKAVLQFTLDAIDSLLMPDPANYNAQDAEEFKNDSVALFDFGWWFVGEKALPFFQQYKTT